MIYLDKILNVFIGIDRAGLVGADGETHQGVFDIAFLRHMPNLVIMMPKDENEGQHMVKTAIDYDAWTNRDALSKRQRTWCTNG